MKFFDRKIELVVYTETQSYKIRDLHIDFNITLRRPVKSKQENPPMPNQAMIKIFNLSETTRNLFEYAHRGIDFKAGYGENLALIFRGVTTNVFSQRLSADWETSIFAADGHKEWADARFNKSYAKGTSVLLILQDMAAAMGLPPSIDYTRPDTLLTGASFAGKVKDTLTTVCQNYNLTWSIQRGTLEIYDNELPQLFETKRQAVVLSPTSGLIGSPTVRVESRNETKDKGKNKKADKENAKLFYRVSARSLLHTGIYPNVPVLFRSQYSAYEISEPTAFKAPKVELDNTFICDSVNHFGSNYGNEFYSDVETSESEVAA